MTPGPCTCNRDIAVSQSAATETRKHTFFSPRHSVRNQMAGVFVTQSRCMSGYFFMYTTKTAIIALVKKRRQPFVSHGAGGKKESG